ncbi:MAG: META domain-containing protein [Elusimicrobium sp.]|nr:META domain-containing protein [Elusimicrobium sp.]
MQFDGGRASGKASPGRYTAPFTAGGGNGLTFGTAASAMMMGIREPEGLNDREFSCCFQKFTDGIL